MDVGGEPAVLQVDIFAIFQGLNDRRVGRWTTDAVIFQRLDQAGFRVAWRRFGEVLLAANFGQVDRIALVEFGQAVVLFGLRVLVDLEKAGLDQGRAGGAEGCRADVEFGADRVVDGRNHLAGHCPVPDQLVEPVLILGQVPLELDRCQFCRGRTDGLMGFLRVLGLRLVEVGLFRHDILAILTGNHLANFAKSILRQRHRIGSHVGNQALIAATGIDTFIQLLGDAHGALGGIAQATGRLLLQCRGDKRWLGTAAALALGDPRDRELTVGIALDLLADFGGALFRCRYRIDRACCRRA